MHLMRYGNAGLAELMQRFASPSTRKTDFRRRVLGLLLDTGIIVSDGADTYAPNEEWRTALENVRMLTNEDEAARLQKERHQRQRKAYRERNIIKPEPVPEPPQVDDMRQDWQHHPDGCACRECSQRFGRVIGEHVRGCRCKECHHARRTGKARKAGYLRLAPERPSKPDGQQYHSLSCSCAECDIPMPKFVRPYAGSGVA